jgi:cell division protein FtsA
MNSIENKTQSAVKFETKVVPEKVTFKTEQVFEPIKLPEEPKAEEVIAEKELEIQIPVAPMKPESTETKIRRSFFDKYVDKIKEFFRQRRIGEP